MPVELFLMLLYRHLALVCIFCRNLAKVIVRIMRRIRKDTIAGILILTGITETGIMIWNIKRRSAAVSIGEWKKSQTGKEVDTKKLIMN